MGTFAVLYTRQLHKKSKVYSDGFVACQGDFCSAVKTTAGPEPEQAVINVRQCIYP